MSRLAYLNGRYGPLEDLEISVLDRGFIFSDGVYEVFAFFNRRPLDLDAHLHRLRRSLSELDMACPVAEPVLEQIAARLVAKSRLTHGTLYLQISRGPAPRDHAFPDPAAKPSLFMMVRPMNPRSLRQRQKAGVSVVTTRDLRWKRRDIKSVSLLGNVLAKQQAKKGGGYEAWMLDDKGFITEGSSSTAWIVKDGRLITYHLGEDILPGITRAVIIELIRDEGLDLVERPFTPEEAMSADEAFIASTTSAATPVIRIDRTPVGGGKPGPVTRSLIKRHWRHVIEQTGFDGMAL